MVKLYTKDGDKGVTRVAGRLLSKDHPLVIALGEIDELIVRVGAMRTPVDIYPLGLIQRQLMWYGAGLAQGVPRKSTCGYLERVIDEMSAQLPPLRQFIRPGIDQRAVTAHLARTQCRRAECYVAAIREDGQNIPSYAGPVLQYLNRLGDYLFVLARKIDNDEGYEEEVWDGRPAFEEG